MNASVTAALSLGFIYGLRHALDADHLVAVSTIVSEHKSVLRSSLIGTFWGIGHTASLFVVGLVVVLLRAAIPPHVGTAMEMAVALMLVVLGINVLWKLGKDRGLAVHAHSHLHEDGAPHTHLHLHTEKSHDHPHYLFRIGRRPFLVGLVHGMAGSAALTLAVLTTIPSVLLGLTYIVVFGAGSVGGMLLMSAMISLPFATTARRFSKINWWIRLTAGVASIAFGLVLGWGLLSELRS